MGGTATCLFASWPTLSRWRSLHHPVKKRQCLLRIPVHPGDFCQQTTPAQSSPPSRCSSRVCPEGCSHRLVIKLVVRAGTRNFVSTCKGNIVPAETYLLTVSREKPCLLLAGTLVDLVLGCPLPARLSWPSKSTLLLGGPLLIALALPPALQTSVCLTKTQSQHIRVHGVIVVVIVLALGLIAVPGVVPW
jgi:hypothetical protein